MALDLPADRLFEVLSRFGIGRLTDCGFPGESAGVLNQPEFWRPVGQATLAYGYGLSVTAVQLAQAYAALGAGGVRYPVSMLTLDAAPRGQRAVSEATADAMMGMLEVAASEAGTGRRAAIPGFRVAGKTGTAWKSGPGGYSKDRYLAVFAGLAPASNPRLAAVVIIDEPRGETYYGGDVAAPVFSRIVSGALRMLAVAPDRPNLPIVAQAGVQP
jgi:cell division protein FtsI (penicillin-binding protein 3)